MCRRSLECLKNIGIEYREFSSFVRCLISEISDAQNVNIQVSVSNGSSYRVISDVGKKNSLDPFKLRISPNDIISISSENAEFGFQFEKEIQAYDNETLPAMQRRDV